MRRYILQRILLLVPVLLGVTFLSFLVMRLVPGDVVLLRLAESPQVTAADIERLRSELGLDRPFATQYFMWLTDLLRGDLGESLWTQSPVIDEIVRRIPVTIELTLLAMLVSTPLGILAGVVSAIRQDGPVDYLSRLVVLIGLAVPNFALATVVLVVLATWFNWSPGIWYEPLTSNPGANLRQMFLPAVLLGFSMSASVARMMRSTMLEILRQDYIRTAHAKGLGGKTVITRHALKNAMPPVMTIIGLQFGFMLSGAVVIETIFALPGIGRLTLDAIAQRDYVLVQALVVLLAAIYVTVNLAVDLMYAWLNPRIRYS